MGNTRSKNIEQIIVESVDDQTQYFEEKKEEHDPRSFQAQKNTLFMMTRGERYQDALNLCERLFENFPEEQSHIYFLRGEVYYRMQKDRPALLDFNQSEALGEHDAELFLKRGNLFRRHGCHSDALKDFNHSLSIKEQFYTYQLRAELYREAGNYDAAEQDLKKALHLRSHVGVWYDLAELYYFQGQLHLAEWILGDHVLLGRPDNQQAKKLLHNIQQKLTDQKFKLFESIRKGRIIEESTIEDLFNAVRLNQVWQINRLLKPVGKIDITVRDVQENTLLHAAALAGHTELLFSLSQQGIDLQVTNCDEETPLIVAVKANQNELVRQLLRAGSDPCQRWQGKTILQLAVEQANQDLIQSLLIHRNLLKETGGLIGVLNYAITVQQIAVIQYLLQETPQLVNTAYNGQYPLQTAIEQCQNENIKQCQIEIIETLLDYRPDPNLSIPSGDTAMKLAEHFSDDRVLNLLHHHKRQYKLDELTLKARTDKLMTQVQKRLDEKGTYYNHSARWAQVSETIQDILINNWKICSILTQSHIEPNILKSLEDMLVNQLVAYQEAIFSYDKITHEICFQPTVLSHLLQDHLSKWEPSVEVLESKLNLDQSDIRPDKLTHETIQEIIEIRNFCDHFERRFDEMYQIFRAYYAQEMEYKANSQDNSVELGQEVARHTPDVSLLNLHSTLPASRHANLPANDYHYVRNHYRKEQMLRMLQLFSALSPLERTQFSHVAALAISKRYQMQINYLKPGPFGIEQFADDILERVLHYITRKDNHLYKEEPGFIKDLTCQLSFKTDKYLSHEISQKKTITHLFFNGIIINQADDKDGGVLLHTHGEMETDEWTSRGILEKTGVLTHDSIYLADPESSNVQKYGYCYGNIEEADLRRLTKINENGEAWPVGRFATQAICEENLRSSPPRSPSITFFAASHKDPELKDAHVKDAKESKYEFAM